MCRDANASDVLLRVKQEAPQPVSPAVAQTFTGSPFVHTPAEPGPPHTVLPKTKAETAASMPKTQSGQTRPRSDSVQAGVARMAAAAKARREAREREAREGGASSSAAANEADDEVEVTGTRSREEREDELRQSTTPTTPTD